MKVEVVYARTDIQVLLAVELDDSATAREAIERSGLLQRFPEIDLRRNQVGVFGKPCGLDHPLVPGDRVEIYRPLPVDPQQLRRSRAFRSSGR